VNSDPQKTIYLIDASSYLYRAYYSIKPLNAPNGRPVNAVYGFCRMLKKLIDTFKPHYCALVWDSKGKTTRHETYEAYKATRQAPPSDLFAQKDLIIEFADTIGLCQVAEPGIEADDLIYSIAQEQSAQGYTIVAATGDKDMGQMIGPKIFLYDPSKDIMYNTETFAAKIGVPIDRLMLYFALLGDASDNIPGVRGIGEKTAIELANRYSSLDDLYGHLDSIDKKRVRTALEESKENAFLSYGLFKLQYHPSGITTADLSFDVQRWQQAAPFFKKLQFKSMLEGKNDDAFTIFENKKKYWQQTYNFKLVTTSDDLAALCNTLAHHTACALDTETDGLSPLLARLVGLSLCVQEGEAFYIPCGHTTGEVQLSQTEILEALKPYLEDPHYKKYLHNTKFDQKIISSHGVDVAGIVYDTAIAASLVATEGSRVGLKFLSLHYFNEDMLTFADVVTNFKRANFTQVPLDDALYYAAADAHQTFRLVPLLEQELGKKEMSGLYATIELPMTQVLYAMECEGIYCDKKVLDDLDHEITRSIAHLEEEIRITAGLIVPINLNSPKQVQELLFTTLRLPTSKKSAGGDYSTRYEVLVELAKKHPVPALLLKHRELSKLKNTYIDALPRYINRITGRIHTTFNQIGVATGRLSSTEPNLQNIPHDGKSYSTAIRSAFKAKPGHLFLSADYSQIELRVLAYLSQDPALIDAFAHNRDIHQETAARIFDSSAEMVTQEQRQIGKRINFSLLYGVTPFGLSQDLKIPLSDARHYIERYFTEYARVKVWIDETIIFAKSHGYVQTYWGRRRYLPAINERNQTLFQEACRMAVNTIVQGTAAELMKIGMIRLHTILRENPVKAHMLLQIHDELLIECPKEIMALIDEQAHHVLESVVDWNVPLLVNTRVGTDWGLIEAS
jgi:DNA polymerase-1